MPRIYDSASNPWDLCQECWDIAGYNDEEVAFQDFGNRGDGPDGRGNCFGWDDDHPSYDGDKYYCCICGVRLTDLNA
jgi:hypothetical protein